jgi:hypothetical protein
MRGVLYATAALVLAGIAFQVFLRYTYVKQNAYVTWRVDRVTGASCVLPCEGTPSPTAQPSVDSAVLKAQYEEKVDIVKQRAIALAKPAASVIVYSHPDYTWRTEGIDFGAVAAEATGFSPDSKPDPVRLVCYCNAKGFGWRWEVHTDTREVFSVNDNTDLMKKYGIKP